MSKREDAHFETTVCGIPCGVRVTSFTGARPWRQHTFRGAGPGDCDPPEPEDFEYILLDRKGYPAEWLEDKMTARDRSELESEISANQGMRYD